MFDEHHKEISFDESIIDDHPMMGGLDVQHFAFNKRARREIFERDGGTCQNTGKRFSDGWIVHAAHYDHTRGPNYNNPENGRLLCVEEHMKEHASMGDTKSLRLLVLGARKDGLRTRRFYNRFSYMWERDQDRIRILLDELGYDYDMF